MEVRETSGSVSNAREFAVDLDEKELNFFLEVLVTAGQVDVDEGLVEEFQALAMDAVNGGERSLSLPEESLEALRGLLQAVDGVFGHFDKEFPGDLDLLIERALAG